MPRFSEEFDIGLDQPALDFVDIELDGDTPLYVDPFAISLYEDEHATSCNQKIVNFFQSALNAIRSGENDRAARMLSNLSEPNETRLGVSRGRPQGRGVSGKQAFDLYQNLANSQAAVTGLLSELADCDLFVEGIGSDKISDITTNILRGSFIDYTQKQCQLHNIELSAPVSSGLIWDEDRKIWRERYEGLPLFNNQKIILVPKAMVRRRLSIDSQEYYNKHVLNYLQAEHISANSSLVEVLKNGSVRVTKKSLKEHYPYDKGYLATFTRENPDVLERYKKTQEDVAKHEREYNIDAIHEEFNEALFSDTLIKLLKEIPPGNQHASRFHNLIVGIIEFLFWPKIGYPVKEAEIDDGRKRIDVLYENTSVDGFFHTMLRAPQTRAIKIPVECKNYSKEPANPEFDQLAGRFSHTRGFLGFLVFRGTDNYDLLLNRCRDTAIAGRGFMLPLGDAQIIEMLAAISSGERASIDQRLRQMFGKISS